MSKHPDFPAMRARWQQFSQVTLAEVLQWAYEQDLAPEDVRATTVALRWYSPESDAEREQREQCAVDAAARKEAWERETYERLKAKYEV